MSESELGWFSLRERVVTGESLATRFFAVLVGASALSGCGAKSGLPVWGNDAGAFGAIEGEDSRDERPGAATDFSFPDDIIAGDSDFGRGVPPPGNTTTSKLDLLFVIDNSISMADKQEHLRRAVPDLLDRLVNPACIDEAGGAVSVSSPAAPCPTGAKRQFRVPESIHVGVVSTSMGEGIEVCSHNGEASDDAHLVGTRPRASDLGIRDGFLRWTADADLAALTDTFQELVSRVGEQGCGFESTFEAWYRFLVDPEPFASVAIEPCGNTNANPCARPTGVDDTLLEQRRNFLRSDSLLAIIMLTDEDDCSMQTSGQLYYPARQDITLPRGSSACDANPNDPCCYTCGFTTPIGCTPDPICSTPLSAQSDPLNLRCFDQKRRFGMEFLHPIERYHAGLTNAEVATHDGELLPNPLFSDLTGRGDSIRDPSLVFIAGIVGVPWLGVAVPGNDGSLRYMTARELADADRWAVILGDPNASPPVPPTDALMIQSLDPRRGTSFDGTPLAPPTANAGSHPVNGHEWGNTRRDDLQYACIFPIPNPRDCAQLRSLDTGCDCKDLQPGDNNPLCQDPLTHQYDTIQRAAKAYPAPRHLELLHRLGDDARVASICARNATDESRADYGFRPVVSALVDWFAPKLIGE